MEDGSTMTWAGDSALVADRDLELRFDVRGPDGQPAILEPYMGMASHAVIARDDGAVFIHLHPLGTIAMASQLVFVLRQPGDTVRGPLGRRITAYRDPMDSRVGPATGSFSIPYAFPRPGHYRMWVQVKRGGRILTGVFEMDVGGSGGSGR